MNIKLKPLKNPAVLWTGIIFFLLMIYYVFVNPVIPYDHDDWRYFGYFESDPIPRLGRWNITRILPEHLMPLSGFLTGFIIFPIVGDYLFSASIALAILIAVSLSGLFVVSYRFFHTLCEDKNICTLISVMMMLLCFAIFKHNPTSNTHMFSSPTYNLYCCYVLPNILNSIMTLILMRHIILYKKLSILSNISMKTGLLLVGIYFCIFSMLFSAGILLAFAISITLQRLYAALRLKKKLSQRIREFIIDLVKHYNIILIIIGGTGVAMVLELQSGRSNIDWDSIYTGSLFSIDFMKLIVEAASGFLEQIKWMNSYVLLIIACIVLTTIISIVRRRGTSHQLMGPAVTLMISLCFLVFFYILVAAKGGTDRTRLNYCIYGVFFFLVLLVSLSSLYLLQEVKYSHLLFPFILVVLTLIMLNATRWPYESHHAKGHSKIMNQTISAISEADTLGYASITLYAPKDYVLPHWALSRLSHTLYYHKITSSKISIVDLKYSTDNTIYYMTE